MGYLLKKGFLDCSQLLENFSWAFSLFNCVTEEGRFVPLAQLGIPTPADTKPTWKQIHRFLDIIFVDDAQGKDLALKKFTAVEQVIPEGSEMLTICRKLESASPFYALGLGVVYELHEKNEGYDPNVETIILDSSPLVENLCQDLRKAQAKWPLEQLFGNPQLIQKIKKSSS